MVKSPSPEVLSSATRTVVLALALLQASCVSTPYGSVAPSALSDEQLLAEIGEVYRQLGIADVGLDNLRRLMPPPTYQITANSFSTVTATGQTIGNTTYVTGTSLTTTRYEVTEASTVDRQLNQLAQSIQRIRISELQKRGVALGNEYQLRVINRRRQAEVVQERIRIFYATHPALRSETTLLQQVFPWVQEPTQEETLAALAAEAEAIIKDRDAGEVSGRWYGALGYLFSAPGVAPGVPTTGNVRVDAGLMGDGVVLAVATRFAVELRIEGDVDEGGVFRGAVVKAQAGTGHVNKNLLLLEGAEVEGPAGPRKMDLAFRKDFGSGTTVTGWVRMAR